MKRLLLLLLLTLPALSYAQNYEFRVYGGFNFHSKPASNRYTTVDEPKVGYAAGASASLLLPHAQIGVGVEMLDLYEVNTLAANYTATIENHLAKPLFTPYAFYNRRLSLGKGYIYGGIMVGGAIAQVGVNDISFNNSGTLTGYTTNYNQAYGFVVGLQGGGVVRLGKHVGISGEVGMRYTDYNYKQTTPTLTDDPYHYRVFYFPVTLGLRYRI